MLPALDMIKSRIEQSVPGAAVEVLANEPLPGQASLLLRKDRALEIARFLRDDPEYRLDFLSNVTGVDWVDIVTNEMVNVN
jgi:NADH-quinone oxidoreductase subunit C